MCLRSLPTQTSLGFCDRGRGGECGLTQLGRLSDLLARNLQRARCRDGCRTGLCPARLPCSTLCKALAPRPLSGHLLAARAEGIHQLSAAQARLSSLGASFVQNQGWTTACSDSAVHMHRFHALFPIFPCSAGSGAELCGSVERSRAFLLRARSSPPLAASSEPADPRCPSCDTESSTRVPAAAGLDVPRAGEMLGREGGMAVFPRALVEGR